MNDKEAMEINKKYAWRQLELAIEDIFYSNERKRLCEVVEENRRLNISDAKIREFFKTTLYNLKKGEEQ